MFTFRYLILYALLSLYIAQSLFAQSYTMRQAVDLALSRNPQLAVAKSDIAIAQARLIDAGKLENPLLEFAVSSQVKDGPDREGSVFIGYSQQFPVTNKLLHQRNLGKAEVQVACAEVLEVERNFIARVQKVYIQAIGTKALVNEMKRIESAAQKSIEQARSQLAAALGSELDVASAETEKVLALQDRVLAEGRYRQALASLRPLLGLRLNQPVTLTDDLSTIISGLNRTVNNRVTTACSNRPDLVAAEVRRLAAQLDQELALAETLEDWGFSAGYEAARTVDEPVGAERERFVSMGVKIPIPVRKKGEGRIAETRAQSERVDNEIQVIKSRQRTEVANAMTEVEAARLTASCLNQKVLPQLKSREEKTWQAYQEGLVSFNQVVMLQQQIVRTQKAITQTRVDEALALARLQHAFGAHPSLKEDAPRECIAYQFGAEPRDPAWSPNVITEHKVVKAIQAVPSHLPQPANSKLKIQGLKKVGRKLFGKFNK